jgi:3-deoxy-D-manno-octulosonate 8-phosphate phosphatase (KDO 8-P phosphatase)
MDIPPNLPAAIYPKLRQLKMLILDVDGVLTDGRLWFDSDGHEYKTFHARDGHGIKLLQQTGVQVAVISGRSSPSVALRLQNLGIQHVYQGYDQKLAALADLMEKTSIGAEHIAHIGDDLLDLPLMRRVGVGIAVSDANFAVRQYADWCTQMPGGQGAVREVCDSIMHIQGHFNALLDTYLQ